MDQFVNPVILDAVIVKMALEFVMFVMLQLTMFSQESVVDVLMDTLLMELDASHVSQDVTIVHPLSVQPVILLLISFLKDLVAGVLMDIT